MAVPAPLAFMRLNEAWNWRGFVDILPTLQKRSDNFLLIGDSTILVRRVGKAVGVAEYCGFMWA